MDPQTECASEVTSNVDHHMNEFMSLDEEGKASFDSSHSRSFDDNLENIFQENSKAFNDNDDDLFDSASFDKKSQMNIKATKVKEMVPVSESDVACLGDLHVSASSNSLGAIANINVMSTASLNVSSAANMANQPISEIQYVIVEDAIDLNNLEDFNNVQVTPCSGISLSEIHPHSHRSILGNAKADSNFKLEEEVSEPTPMDLIAAGNDDITDSQDNVPSQAQEKCEEVKLKASGQSFGHEDPTSFGTLSVCDASHGDTINNNKTVSNIDLSDENIDFHSFGLLSNSGTSNRHSNSTDKSDIDESSGDTLTQFTTISDKVPGDTSHKDLNEQLNLKQDKTTFSENLGLIPADTKIIAERAKNIPKGMRTRKRLETQKVLSLSAENGNNETSPVPGHKHTPGCYKCGCCSTMFLTMCRLHDHLQQHGGGSYHYDHTLFTAFPKLDSTCSYAQTVESYGGFENRNNLNICKVNTNIRKALQVKLKEPKNVQPKNKSSQPIIASKRKRGRPRKIKETTNFDHTDIIIENVATDPKIVDSDIINGGENGMYNEFETPVASVSVCEEINDTQLESQESNTTCISPGQDLMRKDSELLELLTEGIPSKRKRKSSMPRKIMVEVSTKTEEQVHSKATENKIQCEFCPSVFEHTRGLLRHETIKHSDKMKFECNICKQKFMREYNLERHKLCSHTSGKHKSFLQQRRGIYRAKRVGVRAPRAKEADCNIMCEICKKEVPKSKFVVHNRLHTGERPFICHVCGKGMISEKKLRRHIQIHSDANRHTCEVCGLGFSMKYKLRTHMFVHTGHKPFLCSVCGGEFNNSTSLLHHHRTVHLGDKRFECNMCGGRYGKKSQLEEHMFSHSSERTQTCRYCGKSFKHGKSLRRHEQTHVSDTKFQCDQCDSKFSRKDNLDRHKMCHVDTALQCSFCRKKFKERQPLLEHEQFHINSRKFNCHICKEKFQDETFFYNHMEKTHQVSKDMVYMVNSLVGNAVDKPLKTKKSAGTGTKRMSSVSMETSDVAFSGTATSLGMDTLNLSMSVAGIFPTPTSSQDINILNQVSTQLQSNMSLNPSYISGTNTTSNLRNIITNSMNAGFAVPRNSMIHQGMQDPDRMGTMNPMDPGMIQVSLGPDGSMMPQEQHRLMQEALGATMHGMSNQHFRLQNMF